MSSYVIPLFPAAAASPLPTRDAVAAELSRLRDRVDAGLPGKADKVPSAAAGNLASLDASGNLVDSGATPASIKDAAVAAVVANAPGTMDTLKEIADILGSAQQSGTVLKRISDLETGKADSSSLAAVATSGSYDDLSGRPTVPAVDATLATPGAAADAKAAGDALDGKRGLTDMNVYKTAWRGGPEGGQTYLFSLKEENLWATGDDLASAVRLVWWGVGTGWTLEVPSPAAVARDTESGADAPELRFTVGGVAWTLGRVAEAMDDTLAKVSQIPAAVTVDSALSGSSTHPVQNKVVKGGLDGKADKVTGATEGNLAALTAQGNLADSGAKVSDFATSFDLPYRLVALTTPTEWVFSGVEDWFEITSIRYSAESNGWYLYVASVPQGWDSDAFAGGPADATSLAFVVVNQDFVEPDASVIATKTGYALVDRAVNAVSVTGATTLTLPEKIDGKSRDFYLKMAVTGSQSVSFSPSTGITYTGFGDPAKTYSSGTYILRFTETSENEFCVTDMLAEYADVSDLPYALVAKTPVNGAVTLSDRAVNLVSPTVTAGTPAWTWSDGLDHGQPKYGVVYDDGEYQEYGWGFSGEDGTLSHLDSLGNYYDFVYATSDDTELSFYDNNTEGTLVASLVTPYETDVASLALPPVVTGKVRDFMVRLAMPENAAMFSWPSGVEYETEDGQMPDVSEPGVYLLAFTETGAGRFALMCRKVQGVE